MITYSKEQAQAIVDRHNELANFELRVEDVHHLFDDYADDDMRDDGEVMIEVRAMHSKTGNPVTFTITRDEIDWQE